jgi:hypothetical protein
VQTFDEYDIYTHWIVAFVDGQWRHVHIQPGWITLAPWLSPNAHVGVFREKDLAGLRPGQAVPYDPIPNSPYALVAGPVIEPKVKGRIRFVRFGRIRTGIERDAILDFGPPGFREIAQDLDDAHGLDPNWIFADPPAAPPRWIRTVRSLALS